MPRIYNESPQQATDITQQVVPKDEAKLSREPWEGRTSQRQ